MPVFKDDDDTTGFKSNGSGFSFSGVNVSSNKLGASEYTLVGISADRSGSVAPFVDEIEGCLRNSLQACQDSPRVDNLLVRLTSFGGAGGLKPVEQEHGYRLLSDCHLANYTKFLKAGGGTPLYDATVDMVDSLATYGKALQDQKYTANGLLVILTDGGESGMSTMTVRSCQEAFERAKKSEALESLLTILIGINIKEPAIAGYLKAFEKDAGFDQYIEAPDASPKTFSRIAGFISKSVSSQSMAIGTGAKSQVITF